MSENTDELKEASTIEELASIATKSEELLVTLFTATVGADLKERTLALLDALNANEYLIQAAQDIGQRIPLGAGPTADATEFLAIKWRLRMVKTLLDTAAKILYQ